MSWIVLSEIKDTITMLRMPAGDFYYSKPRFLGSKVGMVEAHAIIYAVVLYKSTAAAIKVFNIQHTNCDNAMAKK